MSSEESFDHEAVLCGRELPHIYTRLVEMANEFAVLGYIQIARDMITLLLTEYSSEWQLQMLRSLALGFKEADVWPDGVPEDWKTEEGIGKIEEAFQWRRFVDHNPHNEVLLALAREDDRGGQVTTRSRCRRLGSADDPGVIAIALSVAVRHLSLIGMPLAQIEQDSEVQHLLELISQQMVRGDRVWALMERRNLWPLLLSSALARKIPVDDEKIREVAKDALSAFSERFRNGRKPSILESLSIPELVQRINDNTRTSLPLYEEGDDFINVPETLLKAPLADIEERIAAMDERVGEVLPEDYKEFLRTTNGLESSWSGLFLATPLHGVDDVKLGDMEYMENMPVLFHDEPTGVISINWELGRWPVWKEVKLLALSPHPDDPWSTIMMPPSETRKVFEAYKEALTPSSSLSSGQAGEASAASAAGEEEGLLLNGSNKEMIQKFLMSGYGNWEEAFLNRDSWMVVRDKVRMQGMPIAFGSFKMFLEMLAVNSKNVPRSGSCLSKICRSGSKKVVYS